MSTDTLAETAFPPDLRERTGKVYISAPQTVDVEPVRTALRANGFQPLSLEELPVGGTLADVIREGILRSDFIVAVMDNDLSRNVMYEVGLADGLGTPVVIVSPPKTPLPFGESRHPRISGPVNDPISLSRQIAQWKDNVLHSRPNPPLVPKSKPLGDRADHFRHRAGQATGGDAVRAVMTELMTELGLIWAERQTASDYELDMAVWCDEWLPWVPNPLAIELKGRVGSAEAANQLQAYAGQLADRSLGWGLLLATQFPLDFLGLVRRTAPYVLFLTYDELFDRLRTDSFPRIVVTLRNKRVHGEG
jgi:hypothetical protein